MKLPEQLAVLAQGMRLAPNTIKVYQAWVKQFAFSTPPARTVATPPLLALSCSQFLNSNGGPCRSDRPNKPRFVA